MIAVEWEIKRIGFVDLRYVYGIVVYQNDFEMFLQRNPILLYRFTWYKRIKLLYFRIAVFSPSIRILEAMISIKHISTTLQPSHSL